MINTIQPVDLTKAIVQSLPDEAWAKNDVLVNVLRLDRIHPVLSGNKWFKLKYHLQQAIQQNRKGLLTFGGAWSNHLVASSIACKLNDLACIGVVRGEAAAQLSPTLQEARHYGMQLQFVSRTAFSDEEQLIAAMQTEYPDFMLVPQGGQSEAGIQGAAEILALTDHSAYTHIACAAGTGTMLTGLVRASRPEQHVLGISSLKIADRENNSLLSFVKEHTGRTNFSMLYDYHFGGYARSNDILLRFMNTLYNEHQLPTDFVYTAKLMYGINDLIYKNYFPQESRLLAIHSGGLQGNRSLAPGILPF